MPRPSAVATFAGSVSTGSLAVLGQAPAYAMGATYVAMADSMALAMQNAVAAQQRGQVVAEAALGQVLALIITKGASSP